jgi:hypothetical protein
MYTTINFDDISLHSLDGPEMLFPPAPQSILDRVKSIPVLGQLFHLTNWKKSNPSLFVLLCLVLPLFIIVVLQGSMLIENERYQQQEKCSVERSTPTAEEIVQLQRETYLSRSEESMVVTDNKVNEL